MATELLVDDRVQDGRRLLGELARSGVAVEVAVCARDADDGRWLLYLATDRAADPSVYRTLYACMDNIPGTWLDPMSVRLVRPSAQIAQAALAIRARSPGGGVIRYAGRLGDLDAEEAYIYPKNHGEMDFGQLMNTLIAKSRRSAVTLARPSTTILKGGETVHAIILGFSLQEPDGLIVRVLDDASGRVREIAGDDIARIL